MPVPLQGAAAACQSSGCPGPEPPLLPLTPPRLQIVTGQRPQRGQLRTPAVPQECPEVGCAPHASCFADLFWFSVRPRQQAGRATPRGRLGIRQAATTLRDHAPWLQEVRALLTQCLETDPAARPTAAQLVARLSELVQPPAPPPVSRGRSGPLGCRRPAPGHLAACLGLARVGKCWARRKPAQPADLHPTPPSHALPPRRCRCCRACAWQQTPRGSGWQSTPLSCSRPPPRNS